MAKKRSKLGMKGNQLVIRTTVFLNKRRTKEQKEKLLQFITWCIEDRVSEFNAAGDKDEETHADTHEIGSIVLDSEAGMREICI